MRSQIFATVSILVLIASLPLSFSVSLYSPADPLHELDNSNFESIVFGKSNVWIIQFYNNWCGHCINFAPVFKQFARDIETWKNVVDIGVVNCADSRNTELCRKHDVESFPTIKLFKPFVNESVKGDKLNKRDRTPEVLETALVNLIEDYQNEKAPNGWPILKPLESKSVSDVRKLLKGSSRSIILYVEDSNIVLGKKVILDLTSRTSSIIRRVLKTNKDLLNDLNVDLNTSLSAVFKIDKTEKQLLLRFPADANSTYVREQTFKRILGTSKAHNMEMEKQNSDKFKLNNRNTVHMTDLENALRTMLYTEISVISHIYGDRLQALKSFLLVLKNFFPGRPPVMGYLSKLNEWASQQKNISGENFAHKLDELQTTQEYLPEMKNFVRCRGSEPNYRGYPCSLWTLFHTLTVQANIIDEKTAGGMEEGVMAVLPNIRNYIKYFFTCEECVQNFFKMDQNVDRDDTTSANVVLWLWSAHNKVNKRLSGELTEDPRYPKIQFPTRKMCPKCRLENSKSDEIKWDEVQVLRFLRQFYSKENIEIGDMFDSAGINRSSMVNSLKNVSFYQKWSFQWFSSTDISLCVSLYIVSALLLILIFLLFRQRRRRKRSQAFKYFTLYP